MILKGLRIIKILDIITEAILADNLSYSELNPEIGLEASRALVDLNNWVQSRFSDREENDLAFDKIYTLMCARDKWMLSNGIVIGMQIANIGKDDQD